MSMSMRPTLFRIHFNKQKQCWSVHNRGVCHMASHLQIHVPMESQERPDLRSNPRYFFVCKGFLSWEGKTAVIR